MSAAVRPINTSVPLQFHWDADNVNDQYYLYMHFNEVNKKLAGNKTRTFNITVNDKLLFGPVIPRYRVANTTYNQIPYTGAKTYEITFSKNANASGSPILNAFEIYKVKDFSRSETHRDDGKLALLNTYAYLL